MDSNTIRAKIYEIQKIVDGIDEPFRTESFKILFSKAMSDESSVSSKSVKQTLLKQTQAISKQTTNTINPLAKLSVHCKVSEEQLRNVLDYENGQFIILKKVQGNSTAEKQVTASLCILTAWAKGMDTPWLSTIKLGDSLRELSINTKHLGENITKTDYFVLKGSTIGAKYHITTQGWQKGLEILKSLAQ